MKARSKRKMIGDAEQVPKINSPTPPPASVPRLKHTSWYMSDHYSCVQYFLFCQSGTVIKIDNLDQNNFLANQTPSLSSRDTSS